MVLVMLHEDTFYLKILEVIVLHVEQLTTAVMAEWLKCLLTTLEVTGSTPGTDECPFL